MPTIYFVSGLGADERVFTFLKIEGFPQKFIHWEVPGKNEKLADYCTRLIPQIDTSGEVILIGVSFGGIITQEIAQQINVSKVIIISSVKSVNEFDWQLKMVRRLGLIHLVPPWFLKWSNKLTADFYFSTETPEESKLLHAIIEDTDKHFSKWAITEIMRWKGNPDAARIIHFHGEKDRIFPVKNIRNYTAIEGAGHFMIVNRARQITELILKNLD